MSRGGNDLLRRRGRDPLGLPLGHHLGTGRAHPVVTATGARHALNMISAVTAQGLLRFSTYTGPFTAAMFIDFCTRLLGDTDGPVYLVVDGHPVERPGWQA